MPFLERPGARLYHEVHGRGPAIVFAHGLGGSHVSWWQQVPHFATGHACVVFAHRGFAPSTAEAAADSLPAAFVGDLEALLDELALSRVVLVAQSMGGWTCLGYALRHPERVRGLVMADTTGGFPRSVEAAGGQELIARGIHPAAGERMAREQPALHHLYRELDALSLGLDKAALRRALGEWRDVGAEQLAGLQVPVLAIAGAEDVVIAPEAVRHFAAQLPNSRFELVAEAGHSVYFERPRAFNRLLDGFLSSLGA